jgi:hypothetical protein
MFAYTSPHRRLRRRARHGVQGAQAGSDFRLGGRAKIYAGLSLRVGDENAAPHHHVFVRGQADALLLFMADQGKWASKGVARFLAPPSRDSGTTSISISGEGVAGHRAIDSALHLEIEEQARCGSESERGAACSPARIAGETKSFPVRSVQVLQHDAGGVVGDDPADDVRRHDDAKRQRIVLNDEGNV